ncbi:hypothetical protein ABG067_009573, partial [Albugo candida]
YDEEFGTEDEWLDEETALMRAIEESRETAARERVRNISASGGGESSTSGRAALASSSGAGELSTSAGTALVSAASGGESSISPSQQQQQTSRKGKER